jgi:hypothetical protein
MLCEDRDPLCLGRFSMGAAIDQAGSGACSPDSLLTVGPRPDRWTSPVGLIA